MMTTSVPPQAARAGLRDAVASEWTKIRSVRSTWWTLSVFVLVPLVLGAGLAAVTAASISSGQAQAAGLNATEVSLSTLLTAGPLVLMVLGALVITAEYSTGMIRASLTAQPRRETVVAAKGIVFAAVAVVMSAVTAFIAFFLVQAILGGTGRAAALSDPGVPGAIIGTAVFVSLIGLLSYGFGLIIRHTAGTIATMVGVLYVVPLITEALPGGLPGDIGKWLPTSAGNQMVAAVPGPANPALFSAWPQLGVTAGWAVVLVVIGAALFSSRDA